jgi:hypothetical protein
MLLSAQKKNLQELLINSIPKQQEKKQQKRDHFLALSFFNAARV